MNPKKPLTREELTNKLFKHHGLIPTDAFNEIEANTRLECQQAFMPHAPNKKQYDKLVDNQMAEISRLQVYAEKQESKFNEMVHMADKIQCGLGNILRDRDAEISKLKEELYHTKDGIEIMSKIKEAEIAQFRELVKEAEWIIDNWLEAGVTKTDNWLAKAKKLLENGHNDR